MKALLMSDSMPQSLGSRAAAALSQAASTLLESRGEEGYWVGELSSSALSTATAVCALGVVERSSPQADARRAKLIEDGLQWLRRNQNPDGGWGDTVRSLSNISTTALGSAAFGAVAGADQRFKETVAAAERWLHKAAGGASRDALASAIERRYGKDRTFSVPILMACVLGNRFESGKAGWRRVLPLPFELAALPQQWYGAIRLPVVSYALPALIAIGQAREHHLPAKFPVLAAARRLARQRTLRKLAEIQPPNGGFLEAIPLTSFVVMSLASMGLVDHEVVRRGLGFLEKGVRQDGSWPIDTNLATWLTTLSINALLPDSQSQELPSRERARLTHWLLDQQNLTVHPYTGAQPGGWAWTDLPGGVPDADDTAGVVLALAHLRTVDSSSRVDEAAGRGIDWLLQLQNRDGGIPTFCRGWGTLPFDRSAPDLTAHAIRAWLAWLPQMAADRRQRVQTSMGRAAAYLVRTQHAKGFWLPLWFGNQFSPDDENATYGTSRVLLALTALKRNGIAFPHASFVAGLEWMLQSQNKDGGWSGMGGGPPSIEETALALEALAEINAVGDLREPGLDKRVIDAIQRGLDWLLPRVESGEWLHAAPIGFYFAKLWYFERLYPVIFTVSALRKLAASPDAGGGSR